MKTYLHKESNWMHRLQLSDDLTVAVCTEYKEGHIIQSAVITEPEAIKFLVKSFEELQRSKGE